MKDEKHQKTSSLIERAVERLLKAEQENESTPSGNSNVIDFRVKRSELNAAASQVASEVRKVK